MHLTVEAGKFDMPVLAEALGVPRERVLPHAQPLKGLIADGPIRKWYAGRETHYAVAGAHTVTLADLLERAESCVDPDKRNAPGRRAKMGESRMVETLTSTQIRDIRAVGGVVADFVGTEGDSREQALRRVGLDYFVWTDSAGDGREGDWACFLALVTKASEAKSGAGHRNLSNHISAARTLLDLAATQNWIARTAKHAEKFEAVPAEWDEIYNRWRPHVEQRQVRACKVGMLELMGACHVLGFASPDVAEWLQVARHLEARWRENKTPDYTRKSARAVYRALREAGEIKEGPEWYRGLDRPTILVPVELVEKIGDAYGSNTNLQWRRPDDATWAEWLQSAEGLVAGPYGLQRFLEYQTAPDDNTLDALGLPARGVFAREKIRPQNLQRAEAAWRSGTIGMHLKRLMFYAGWLAQHRGIDFSKPGCDLRVLLDRDNLEAFRLAYTNGFTTVFQFYWIVSALARIASPYMEAVAMRSGSEDIADQMAAIGRLLDSPKTVDGRPSWKAAAQKRMPDQAEVVRQQAKRVKKALTQDGRLDEHAWDVLVTMKQGLVDLMVQESGGLSLDQQIEAISNGAILGREWARRTQEACLLQDQLVAPLRQRTILLMTCDTRHWSGEQPWTGRVYAEYPEHIVKGGRNFNPEYLRAEDNCPDSGVWHVFDGRVFGLYVMAGGARDVLLTGPRGRKWESEYFYVPDAATSDAKVMKRTGARLVKDAYESMRERMVDLTRSVTGLPDSTTLRKQGGLGSHSYRHAFGSKWAPENLVYAAEYLHHADINTTRKHYCAQDASNMGGARFLAQARSRA